MNAIKVTQEYVGTAVELSLQSQDILQVWNKIRNLAAGFRARIPITFITRVAGEGDKLLEDVSGHHPRLLPEHGVQLSLAPVVAEEVPQLLRHDGRLVFARQLAVWSLQYVGLS